MFFNKPFPAYRQLDATDCGPTCLKIISKYYGKNIDLEFLRENSYQHKGGVSLKGLSIAAEILGFDYHGILLNWDDLRIKASLPCVAHWNGNHFLVIYKTSSSFVWVSDPEKGLLKLSANEFKNSWIKSKEKQGIVMLLQPTSAFYDFADNDIKFKGVFHIKNYFLEYKGLLKQLFFGLLISSIIQLTFPFLTQSLLDYGIVNQNYGFLTVIVLGQLFLTLSLTAVNIIRGWFLLHISTRVNINMMSDFLRHLMKLPISFFEKRTTGDIMQRIHDNARIEEFITGGSLGFVFDIFNILLFGAVLAYYDLKIFVIFTIGTTTYVFWALLFMKEKAKIDDQYFKASADTQNKLLQIVGGIRDIKLNGSHKRRKNNWYYSHIELFKVNISFLKINHWQIHGGSSINQIKNIIILFVAATAVIDGTITLGAMLAIQFIVGQLNVPIDKLATFLVDYQKASLSIKRLLEVHNLEGEEASEMTSTNISINNIKLENVGLRYKEPGSPWALKNLNLIIPNGKITAIVGPSGSGKSSLLNLLVKFYSPTLGKIYIGENILENINSYDWRKNCGVVLQEGILFDDTIENNITESSSEDAIDEVKYENVIKKSNLKDLIDSLPYKSNTRVGENGSLISGGERQRILIARALYKDPDLFLLDEATSSLDSINEKQIIANLEEFYQNKTVVIIAHRMSTILNADKIVVLDKGQIVEEGKHKELLSKKGFYYDLFINQIDMRL